MGFYESTTVTGPFILEPQGVHQASRVLMEPPKSQYTCRLFRAVGLSNFAIRIETGPGVSPGAEANVQQATLLSACETSEATSAPTPSPTPAPTKKPKCKNF